MPFSTRYVWRAQLRPGAALKRRALCCPRSSLKGSSLLAITSVFRHIKPLAAAWASLLLLVMPATAGASRSATVEEAAAISAVYETDPECSEIVVSERDSRYARWRFTVSDECEPLGDGFGIARRDDNGAWHDVYQASDPSDPCPVTPVPTEPGVELGACAKPSKNAHIRNFATDRLVVKPRKLPHGAHSFLGRLRWRGWNRVVATASGVLDYEDRTASFKSKIRLRASRVRFCGTKRTYTRMSLTFVRAADRRRFGHFEGTLKLECPEGFDPRAPRS